MSDKQSQILAALERWEQRFNGLEKGFAELEMAVDGLEKGLDRFRVDVMDRIDRLHDRSCPSKWWKLACS